MIQQVDWHEIDDRASFDENLLDGQDNCAKGSRKDGPL